MKLKINDTHYTEKYHPIDCKGCIFIDSFICGPEHIPLLNDMCIQGIGFILKEKLLKFLIMKIAYQDKDCCKIQAGNWEDCKGCIFRQDIESYRTWPCDLIPGLKCAGFDTYIQVDELEDIFRDENMVK